MSVRGAPTTGAPRRPTPAAPAASTRRQAVSLSWTFGVLGMLGALPGVVGCALPPDEGTVARRDDELATDGAPPAPWSVTIAPTAFVHLPEGPLASIEGPPIAACGPGGLLPEGDLLELRTAWCDPADVVAPLPVDIPAGTRLDLTLAHSALVADGGEAHLALLVGDEPVWEHTTTLPAPATFLAPRIVLAAAHPAGTPVVLHVHNHGSNTYALIGLRLSSP